MLCSEVHPKCLDSLYLTTERWWNINIHVRESKQLSVRSPRAWGFFFYSLAFNTGSTFSIFNFLTSLFKHLADNMGKISHKKLEFSMINAENEHGF